MPQCCAYGCLTQQKKSVKFYRLPDGPANEARRKIWVQNIGRACWTPSRNSRLCYKHFTADQFEKNIPLKLKPNAIPSVFSHRNIPKTRKTPADRHKTCELWIQDTRIEPDLIMDAHVFAEDICRLCLWKSNKLLSIFGDEGEAQEISTKIRTCLPIMISKDDSVSKMICSQCVYKLEMFSEFRNACVRSDSILMRYNRYTPSTPQVQQTPSVREEQVKTPVPLGDSVDESKAQFTVLDSLDEHTLNHDQRNLRRIHKNTSKRHLNLRNTPIAENPSPSKTLSDTPDLEYKCSICERLFDNKPAFQEHCTSLCSLEYTCRCCDESFQDSESLDAHVKNHGPEGSFICTVCSEDLESRAKLKSHLRHNCVAAAISNDHQYASTKTDGQKVKRRSSKAELKVVLEPIYKCQVCDNKFRSKSLYERHMKQKKHLGMVRKVQQKADEIEGKVSHAEGNNGRQIAQRPAAADGESSTQVDQRGKRTVRNVYSDSAWITDQSRKRRRLTIKQEHSNGNAEYAEGR